MKDFKQAAEETKKRLGVDLFFICDKKPGACPGWEKRILKQYCEQNVFPL